MDSLASQSQKSQSWLSWFYRGFLVFIFALLLARTAELQIVKGEYYRDLSDNNRIRKITIKAPRGKILARGGEELIGNREVNKQIVFLPTGGYEKKDTDKKEGENVISEWEREYYLGADFAHVGGYIAEANEDEVGKVDPDCPDKGPRKLGSFVGRSGLELEYECTLRGIDGEELIEVDTLGRKVRTLGVKEPIAGSDIKTTIDIGLQRKLATTFKEITDIKNIKLESDGKKGAGIITDPLGQVLAFYSSPSFDPKDLSAAITDTNLPLFNRVLGGGYHPGSTFKIVTSVAGLEDGKITKDYKYEDTGKIEVNGFEYKNWYLTQYGSTEGLIGLDRALARSTDTFFYKVGELVGANSLAKWARKFGYGNKTGIDLPGEISGLVPDPEWKKEYKGENWFLGNTYHMAIGQGDLTATPLEVNRATMLIANGGKLCRPFINSKVSEKCDSTNISKEYIALVKKGMTDACSNGGTAYPFFSINESEDRKVGCKTGTAQTEEENKTHAWFTIFGPVVDPDIVMTILIEKGGEGSSAAAPVAKELFDYWYLQKNP